MLRYKIFLANLILMLLLCHYCASNLDSSYHVVEVNPKDKDRFALYTKNLLLTQRFHGVFHACRMVAPKLQKDGS